MGNEFLMRDRRVNPHESTTELAAVWYAANYYYQASYTEGCEWGGAVFQRPSTNFSLTLRKGIFGKLDFAYIDEDVPAGARICALWHTHLPVEAMKRGSLLEVVNYGLTDILFGYDFFSTDDEKLATKQSTVRKRNFPFYLVTATVIKRFSPFKAGPAQIWQKPRPARMAKTPHRFPGT